MGYAWPQAPGDDGTGTSEDDLQRIVGAQYMNKGILPSGGLTVDGRSDMSYRINSGAAFMWTSPSSRLGVLVPVETVTIPTSAAPPTGSRTDTIYVNLDGIPRVTSGSAPGSSVVLAKFVVQAGTSSTSSAQKAIDRDYAVPTGATLGRLAYWEAPSGTELRESEQVLYSTRFIVPSDRIVRVDITTTLRSPGGPGRSHIGVTIDGSDFRRGLACSHTNIWETFSGTWTATIPGGTHTLSVYSRHDQGELARTAAGDTTTEMNAWDSGVAQ